jgi:enediyne biosynthesis protein E4
MRWNRAAVGSAVAAISAGTILCLPGEDNSAIRFEEVAAASGIRAEMRCGGPEKRWIPEANGSGAAWLDYDNDGRMDLLIVNGSSMERLRKTIAGEIPSPAKGGVYLFRNTGNGKFEDVTERAGLANGYWATGANAADYDNDGYTDILITTIGVDLLYRNNGDGTFTEVGRAAGLSRNAAWHTGSAFGDFDGDGNLDLFITGYVDVHSFSFEEPAPVCEYMGLKNVFCGPVGLPGERGILYRNNGDGTFRDVTKEAGLASARRSHGFTVVADDFNQDGLTDIFVANDSDPNQLFLNKGHGKFEESAMERGVAFNGDGRAQSNMGVAIGRHGGDGRLSVLTTTFHNDYFPLFRQDKSGFFEEVSPASRLATITARYSGWAAGFTDFDNDGVTELWSANGHVYPTSPAYFQPVTVFADRNGEFSLAWSFPAAPTNSYRGGCTADYDNDGRMDLVVLPIAGQPLLLRNATSNHNSWIGLTLRGTRSNRDAIGASVQVESCGKTQFDTVRNGGSYLSRCDPRMHFGLGSCAKVDRVTITWPRGGVQVLQGAALNRYTRIEEPR